MDPLNDDELREVLQKLESSPAPPTLQTRIFGPRRAPATGRIWNRTLFYSVRVPLLALALMAPAFFTLGAVAVRSGRATQLDDRTLRIPGETANQNLVKPAEPASLPAAGNAGLQGTVKLKVRIGPDGRVAEAAVISGEPVLVPAAIDAVKQRIYRPVLLNGSPISVVSQVDVAFRLEVIPATSPVQ